MTLVISDTVNMLILNMYKAWEQGRMDDAQVCYDKLGKILETYKDAC